MCVHWALARGSCAPPSNPRHPTPRRGSRESGSRRSRPTSAARSRRNAAPRAPPAACRRRSSPAGRFRPHRRCGRRRAARRQDNERRAVPGVRQRTASARRSGTGRRKRRTIPARSLRRRWPTSCKTRSRRPMPALVCLQCSYVSPFSGRWRRAEGNLSALIAF